MAPFYRGRSGVKILAPFLGPKWPFSFYCVGRELDGSKQINVLYLDMSKAFDKVSHNQLLHRLRVFGFGGSILKWLLHTGQIFINKQQFWVQHQLRSLPVTTGVLQGSILGPLLFLPYENRLSKAVTKSKIATFADDTKIFRTIYSSFDASLLQNDLSSSEENYTKINLALNMQSVTSHPQREQNHLSV